MKRLLLGCVCLASAARVAAQDPLTAARDLYASAAYEDALSTLSGLSRVPDSGAPPSAQQVEQVEQYKAFCLFALGRTVDAQSVAEGLISRNPLLQVDADASPRIAAMFTDVRRKLMPSLVRERYRTIRTAIERKEFSAAEPQLSYLSRMLDEADKVGASDDTLRDLRVLVDGFMDLTRAAAAAAAPPAAMSPAPSSPGVSGPSTEARAAAPGKTAPQPYDGAAADVVPPVTIRQDIPMIPRELMRTMLMAARTATLEVLVDENGNVERATLREQLNPIYDRLLLAATRAWKYRPATKGSTPVKYLKAISIAVRERAPEPSGQPQ